MTEIQRLQTELNAQSSEVDRLKDECYRLKNAIVNKDSELQRIEGSVDKEKERREAETGELRLMVARE